jgi:putative transposase
MVADGSPQGHCTPTYPSLPNRVKIWFNLITQKAIRRGTFKSVEVLISKIERFVQHHNANTQPLGLPATAD